MDKQQIANKLQEIVSQGGRRRRGGMMGDKLGDVKAEFYNQYNDDGSFEYQKTEAKVAKALANHLYGPVSKENEFDAISAVPQKTIDKNMDMLRQKRALEIKKLQKDYKDAKKIVSKFEDDAKVKKYLNVLEKIQAKKLDINKFEHPNLYKEPMTVDYQDVKDVRTPRAKLDTDELGLLPDLEGLGRKKKLSAYQKHMSVEMKKGKTFKQAVASWRK